MNTPHWLHAAELLLVAVLAAALFLSWQADRRDRARLASQLAAAQKTIDTATTSQQTRDAALSLTLAQIAKLKKSVITPDQILKALPGTISLPAPITLGAGAFTANPDTNLDKSHNQPGTGQGIALPAESQNLPSTPAPAETGPGAIVPQADLKPLYDLALDCKACQARLAAAQSDLSDERAKSAALAKQRDDALRVAKGGSIVRRVARALKWFAIGAAAGAIAAKAAH
ncbi:MAG TPA: hypothetical protein VJN93_13135 [Candidatus Acidoferrum sp.]|nr:hypothetical protein [Candidatus Acidoferrum sp.]